MTLRKPSIFFRAMILGAQGVFYNLFCMCSIHCSCDRGLLTLGRASQSSHISFLLGFATVSWGILKRKQCSHSTFILCDLIGKFYDDTVSQHEMHQGY